MSTNTAVAESNVIQFPKKHTKSAPSIVLDISKTIQHEEFIKEVIDEISDDVIHYIFNMAERANLCDKKEIDLVNDELAGKHVMMIGESITSLLLHLQKLPHPFQDLISNTIIIEDDEK